MTTWVQSALGALIQGGATLGAFLLLSPSIWPRDDFDGFGIAVGLTAAGGWNLARGSAGPLGRWLRNMCLFAIGLAATAVSIYVLIETISGGGMFSTGSQRTAFGIVAGIAVCFWCWLQFVSPLPRFADPGSESRRAEIRANVRREIEEIEKSGRPRPATPDER